MELLDCEDGVVAGDFAEANRTACCTSESCADSVVRHSGGHYVEKLARYDRDTRQTLNRGARIKDTGQKTTQKHKERRLNRP
jgi:hypothetical protein